MKLTRLALLALFALPVLAQAHPGHADPKTTWALSHVASHPFASVLCLGVLTAAAWTVWRLLRPPRAQEQLARHRR